MALTLSYPRQQSPWRDPHRGNAVTWVRRYDESDTYTVDLTDYLESGETCSSVTIVDIYGPTIANEAVTSGGSLSLDVTSGGGTATARIVTSTRTIEIPLQWRLADSASQADGYA